MTSKRTWKSLESRVCQKFSGIRTPLSGSNSQHGTAADCINTAFPQLYIEIKLRASFLHHTLFKDAAKMAKAEDKIPLLVTHVKNEESELVVLRIEDFLKILNSGIASQSNRVTAKTKNIKYPHCGMREHKVKRCRMREHRVKRCRT